MLNSSKIDFVLNNWLAQNDFECTVEMGTDFAYWYNESVITYALVVSERMNRLFLDFAKRQGLEVDCGIFLLSFFHELGHNKTMDLIDDDEYEEAQAIKKTLGDTDEDCETYFNLVDEYEATMWAIDYINNHKAEVGLLARHLMVEINNFYQENEIEA